MPALFLIIFPEHSKVSSRKEEKKVRKREKGVRQEKEKKMEERRRKEEGGKGRKEGGKGGSEGKGRSEGRKRGRWQEEARILYIPFPFSSVQFSHSVVSNSLQHHGLQHARFPCPSPTLTAYSNSCMSIESVMPSNHLILCRPLLLQPSIFPSIIRVFSNESVLHIKWPKYWSFSFSISPSNEYSGLISFRMDWLDLLAVQGTLKSLLQHHSSKVLILRCSTFFIIQLSHPFPLSLPKIMNSRVFGP